jgi:hypothetical protein
VPADAVAALDRSPAVLVLATSGQHRLVAVAVSAEPALPYRLLPRVDDLDGGGTLVRIHADDDLGHRVLLESTGRLSTGGQRYLELGSPLLSLSPPR